jgi:glycosyltransferase involved in cell wall biosynthesis
MKTIVHFSLDFRKDKPQLGGYSRIVNLCSDENSHIIYTIKFNAIGISEYTINSNIKVYELPVKANRFGIKEQLSDYKTLVKKINNHVIANNIKIDILFAHSQIINYFILDGLRKTISRPLLWEVNGIWGKEYLQKFTLFHFALYLLQNKILRNSDFIVFQTKGCLEYIVDNYCDVAHKSVIILNGVNHKDMKVGSKVFNSIGNRKYLFLGRFDELNGAKFLIDFIHKNPNLIDLTFIGDGPLKGEIETLGGNTKYLGSLPRERMMLEFGSYDYVIIPRLDNIDTNIFIPTKLIEAMYNKSVVVCSDVKGLTEVVKDGMNGFVFQAENDNSFHRLLDKLNIISNDQLQIISINGVQTIEDNFLWTENYKKLEKVYNKFTV